ncbi:hypothetical protein CBR_g4726 [Chara braunii]|uniref:Uncharacterized protein n=1 Tax=Chara braunii TaxID=69332 RepID=A0A388KIQ7_CHABU|nr:hypothetical protein CBR_g4726 [Chara braunii]|eukprot:GBG69898.1 hypothetical protein CBR_g4726 [Chara braunii]
MVTLAEAVTTMEAVISIAVVITTAVMVSVILGLGTKVIGSVISGLLHEQAEEREQRKREAAKLSALEEEKKRLQAEEEKRVEARKERELLEAKLGQIVRSSMKVVCESALGRKVDLPGDEESEVSKLRKELDELKTRCTGGTSSSSNLESLRQEKEALQRAQGQGSEEQRLRREIEDLRVKASGVQQEKSDDLVALRMQVAELSGFRKSLDEKNAELISLKAENAHIRNEFKDLRDEVVCLRNEGKRGSVVITEKSPPEEPSRGRTKTSEAMYTPKDLEDLHKAYKEALVQKELALREAEALKERMARMGASKYRQSVRKSVFRKTTPRRLKTVLNAVEIEFDGKKEVQDDGMAKEKGRTVGDVAHDLEEEMIKRFRERRMKDVRAGKKADLEKMCEEEEISYIKLDQAKADIVEIRVRRDYDEWLKTKEIHDDEDQHHDYATSTEEINDE